MTTQHLEVPWRARVSCQDCGDSRLGSMGEYGGTGRTKKYCGTCLARRFAGRRLSKKFPAAFHRALKVSPAAAIGVVYEYAERAGSGCVLWPGHVSGPGYGQLSFGDRKDRTRWLAHRFVYSLAVGPVTPGDVIHHVCAVRRCVNPEHLQMISHQENTAEMLERKAYKSTISEQSSLLEELLSRVSPIDPLHAKVRASLRKARTQHPEAI